LNPRLLKKRYAARHLQKNQLDFHDAFIFQKVQIITGDYFGSKEKGKEKEISIIMKS